MKPPKIKWVVGKSYHWSEGRSWPHAYYENNKIAARINCDHRYIPRDAKTGNHPLLVLEFKNYSLENSYGVGVWKIFTRKFTTLIEAKAFFADYLAKNHEKISPKRLTP